MTHETDAWRFDPDCEREQLRRATLDRLRNPESCERTIDRAIHEAMEVCPEAAATIQHLRGEVAIYRSAYVAVTGNGVRTIVEGVID